jgi:hypothetical protein
MVRQTCYAWSEDEDRSGAETGLAAVADQTAIIVGDTVLMPTNYPLIAATYSRTEFAAYPLVDSRFNAPNINGAGHNNLRIHRGDDVVTKPGTVVDMFRYPKLGSAADPIAAYSLDTDEAGVAHFNSMVMIVSDGPLPYSHKPITHQVSCTVGALTANTWTTATPTLDDTLPSGKYRMWGSDMVCVDAVAARWIIPNYDERPAFIPKRLQADEGHPFNRCINPDGYIFNHWGSTLVLQLEALATSAATPSSVTLYLERIGNAGT